MVLVTIHCNAERLAVILICPNVAEFQPQRTHSCLNWTHSAGHSDLSWSRESLHSNNQWSVVCFWHLEVHPWMFQCIIGFHRVLPQRDVETSFDLIMSVHHVSTPSHDWTTGACEHTKIQLLRAAGDQQRFLDHLCYLSCPTGIKAAHFKIVVPIILGALLLKNNAKSTKQSMWKYFCTITYFCLLWSRFKCFVCLVFSVSKMLESY